MLPIDKPYRWTSADVIRKVKFAAIRHFGKKNLKVGHAGTLDPLATGILLVCLGPATKRAEELQRSAKQYVAGVTFGATTPSYDLEKDIDREFPLDGVSEESVRGLLPSFIGEQDQVAPLFSAKSVDGVRAYETARKLYKAGQLTEENNILQANRINIYNLELLSFDSPALENSLLSLDDLPLRSILPTVSCVPSELVSSGPLPLTCPRVDTGHSSETKNSPAAGESKKNRINVADISGYNLPTAMIQVDCSKGTYIRALARDLGEALGSGAFLSSLRRTKNGGFDIAEALTLDQVIALLD